MLTLCRDAEGDALAAIATEPEQRSAAPPEQLPAVPWLRSWLPLAALLAAVMAFHLFSLVRTPIPFEDESNVVARAWGLVQTGRNLSTLNESAVSSESNCQVCGPFLGAWLQSLSIRALGLSLFSVRLVSLVFGLMLLVAVYTVGYRLYGKRTGLLVVLLTALSGSFLNSSHLARHDIMVAALGFGAIALYVTDQSPDFSLKGVLSGLALGLAFEIHPNAVLYGPPIVALYLLDHGWSTLRIGRFWGFIFGVLCGLAFYAALHLSPLLTRPDAAVASVAGRLVVSGDVAGYSRIPPFLVLDPVVWLQSVWDTVHMVLRFTLYRAPLVAAAIVVLVRRRSVSDRKALALFGVLLLELMAVISGNRPFYYDILISPAADLLLAASLGMLLQRRWSVSVRSYARTVAVLGLLVSSFASSLISVVGNANDDYERVIQSLRSAMPPHSVITGDQAFWFGFPDQRFYAWKYLVYYQRTIPGATLADAFRANRTDFLVSSPHLRLFIKDDVGEIPRGLEFLQIPRTELDGVLEQHGRLIKTIETRTLGEIDLYELKWDSP